MLSQKEQRWDHWNSHMFIFITQCSTSFGLEYQWWFFCPIRPLPCLAELTVATPSLAALQHQSVKWALCWVTLEENKGRMKHITLNNGEWLQKPSPIAVNYSAMWKHYGWLWLISAQAPHLNGNRSKGLFRHKTRTDHIFLFKPTTICHSVTFLMLFIKMAAKQKQQQMVIKLQSLPEYYSTVILKQWFSIVVMGATALHILSPFFITLDLSHQLNWVRAIQETYKMCSALCS